VTAAPAVTGSMPDPTAAPASPRRRPLGRRLRDFFQYRALFLVANGLAVVLSPFGKVFVFFLYKKDMAEPLAPFEARVPIRVEPARPEEIEDVARIEGEDEELLAQFRDRARRGQICYVAWVGDERVAYDWACPRPEPIPGGIMSVGAGEVYCTDAFTAPAWRGNNIHPALNYAMLEGVQDAGYRVAYTMVSALNPSSWKVVRRVGWRPAGVFLYYKGHRSPWPRVLRLYGSLYPCVFARRLRRPARTGAAPGGPRSGLPEQR
jgi:GNAT superfamily N-acetyltransferase